MPNRRGPYRVQRHEVIQPLDTSYRYIPLTHNLNAIVDVEDFERVSQHNWHALWNKTSHSYYARRSAKPSILMQRFILGYVGPKDIDHENRNSLDNRRKNLRICTRSQNGHNSGNYSHNTTGLKGVHWNKLEHRWKSQIRVNGKHIYLGGGFISAEEAAKAYDEAARKYYGEFAVVNFPGS
jgi:hypothetical protein